MYVRRRLAVSGAERMDVRSTAQKTHTQAVQLRTSKLGLWAIMAKELASVGYRTKDEDRRGVGCIARSVFKLCVTAALAAAAPSKSKRRSSTIAILE